MNWRKNVFNWQKKNVEHVENLWNAGQIDKISFNKSKLIWLKEQFILQELEVEREHYGILLQELQGGKELPFVPMTYNTDVFVPPIDEILTSRKQKDIDLLELQQNIAIAEQQIRIQNMERYPDIRIGYNIQGNKNSMYSGIYLGLDVPLWKSKHSRMISRSLLQKETLIHQETVLHIELFLDVHYGDHQMLIEKYQEYKNILQSLMGETLLEESFLAGEISFMEYQQELSFYREAMDTILDMEKQLQQSKSHLLQYRL